MFQQAVVEKAALPDRFVIPELAPRVKEDTMATINPTAMYYIMAFLL
jgi:hypothetical protein